MAVSPEYVKQQIEKLGKLDLFGTKKEVAHLPDILREGEEILHMASGFYDGNTWLIIATDLRLLFLDKGMIFGLKQYEIPYEKISGIKHKTGLFLASVTISSSAGDAFVDQIMKPDAPKLCEIISNHIHSQRTQGNPRQGKNNDDVVSKLERLAILREKGILTEEEFLTQKSKILA